MKAKKLLQAAKTKLKPRGKPEAIVPYQFKPLNTAWKTEKEDPRLYIQQLTARMRNSSPPKEICDEIGVDRKATWGEAIFLTLGKQGALGDVMSAREFLAALGFSGTAAKNLMAVQVNPAETGLAHELLRHAHGLSDEQLAGIYSAMDQLPRAPIVVGPEFYPPQELEATNESLEQADERLEEVN